MADRLRPHRAGHILRDFAELDTVIRYQLLKEEEATLEERLALEEALTLPERFSEVSELPGRLQTRTRRWPRRSRRSCTSASWPTKSWRAIRPTT